MVAEALTNAAKHARASAVSIRVEVGGDLLCVAVTDDGVGGAAFGGGTGLVGLKDRVEALGGRLRRQPGRRRNEPDRGASDRHRRRQLHQAGYRPGVKFPAAG